MVKLGGKLGWTNFVEKGEIFWWKNCVEKLYGRLCKKLGGKLGGKSVQCTMFSVQCTVYSTV